MADQDVVNDLLGIYPTDPEQRALLQARGYAAPRQPLQDPISTAARSYGGRDLMQWLGSRPGSDYAFAFGAGPRSGGIPGRAALPEPGRGPVYGVVDAWQNLVNQYRPVDPTYVPELMKPYLQRGSSPILTDPMLRTNQQHVAQTNREVEGLAARLYRRTPDIEPADVARMTSDEAQDYFDRLMSRSRATDLARRSEGLLRDVNSQAERMALLDKMRREVWSMRTDAGMSPRKGQVANENSNPDADMARYRSWYNDIWKTHLNRDPVFQRSVIHPEPPSPEAAEHFRLNPNKRKQYEDYLDSKWHDYMRSQLRVVPPRPSNEPPD